MNRAYKFCIYPNKEQRIMFAKTFGCVRFIYNRMLADKVEHYKQTGNQNNSVRIEAGKIKLPKVGFVKIIQHRPLKGKIKSVTIEKTPTNKYYVSILVVCENQVPEVELKKFIGLDFSMHDLYVTSEGDRGNYPKFQRRSEQKLARVCRWYSKRKRGGKKRERMRLKVCLLYEKIANQRLDYLHKKSYELAENYDAVYIEALNMRTMCKSMKLGKSVVDNSFRKFREMLSYKLYFRCKKLIIVDKWNASSQLCSSCRYKNAQVRDLSV